MALSELFVVGLGPGSSQCLTPQARSVLERATCLVGYPLYLELLPKDLRHNKEILTSGMKGEVQRCQSAIEAALSGKITALVCSGDPGVYALAGLVLEELELLKVLDKIHLEIIPGVPAVCAAAALLGAPLTHDFACISLSDLLTPWAIIEKRLRAVFEADFVCVLYNPRSKGRSGHLHRALEIAKLYRLPECPLGLVRNAYRQDQAVSLHRLGDFQQIEAVDMLSILFIGNSESRVLDSFLLTPRGDKLDHLHLDQ